MREGNWMSVCMYACVSVFTPECVCEECVVWLCVRECTWMHVCMCVQK